MDKIPEAGGELSSRKFLLTILCLIIITGMSVAVIWAPLIASVFPTFIGGILGILSLYFTGNVMNKYVVGNQMVQVENKNKEEDKEGEV